MLIDVIFESEADKHIWYGFLESWGHSSLSRDETSELQPAHRNTEWDESRSDGFGKRQQWDADSGCIFDEGVWSEKGKGQRVGWKRQYELGFEQLLNTRTVSAAQGELAAIAKNYHVFPAKPGL